MRITVEQLIRLLGTTLGQASSADMISFYLGVGLEELYRHPWPWTKKEYFNFLPKQVTETATFTWVEGDDFITASGAMAVVNWTHTGRYVRLSDRWYRVLDVSHRSALRIYLDKRLVETNTTPTTLTFVRADCVVRSHQIDSVETNNGPLLHWAKEDVKKNNLPFGSVDTAGEGEPSYYADDINHKIIKPAYAPFSAGAGAGLLAAGTYVYFYTRYDYETGLESEAGPILTLQHAGPASPLIKYHDATDRAEVGQGSFGLRLYRSDKNPTSSFIPMMPVNEREPGTPATTYDDTQESPLLNNTEYWRGKQTVLTFLPLPSNESRQVTIGCHDAWGWIPRAHHMLDLGEGSTILNLLSQYISSRLKSSQRNPVEEREALVQFNRQLAWELTNAREPAAKAPGVINRPNYYPGKGLNEEGLFSVLGDLKWPGEFS